MRERQKKKCFREKIGIKRKLKLYSRKISKKGNFHEGKSGKNILIKESQAKGEFC